MLPDSRLRMSCAERIPYATHTTTISLESDVRHPLYRTFQLPATFVALIDFLMDELDPDDPDVWRYATWVDSGGGLFCGDISSSLLGEPPNSEEPENILSQAAELGYGYAPFEILPFCWNGGDGLHYGWAVLAPELAAQDYPCVSFAPVDDHAVWLGDNTKEALENLLVGSMADWSERGRERGLASPAEDARWVAVCQALGLRPPVGSSQIMPGARTKRALRPEIPQGWRYEPTDDGIGVLAPAAAFAPDTVWADRPWAEHVRQVRRYLAEGYPGSALCVLKSHLGYEQVSVRLMCEVYRQLGRELLAERAELWLRLHPSD